MKYSPTTFIALHERAISILEMIKDCQTRKNAHLKQAALSNNRTGYDLTRPPRKYSITRAWRYRKIERFLWVRYRDILTRITKGCGTSLEN